MRTKSIHLSERDLVLAIDGEMTAERGKSAEEHLASCRACRERMSSLRDAIGGFVRSMRSAHTGGQMA